ncbi:MAG: ABC transporter ATP-binding protein [Cellulomonas sp.]|nr:ABC transporter ATP-binding protein [Cellulomonas sp.]
MTPPTTRHTLATRALTLAYGDRLIVDALDLEIAPGRVTVVVGPNASGKSTLLRGLARLLRPRRGAVLLDGRAISARPTREVARILGILPQQPSAPDGVTVRDLIGRGRYPHQRLLQRSVADDDAAVARAMALTATLDLADRPLDELSGGQRQRVWIAMALAQETDILLLDEPTTFLDIAHQVEVLDLLAELNRSRSTTVVMVLHDLNLAARYADVLVVMADGQVVAAGAPGDVLDAETVRRAFGLECVVMTDPVSGTPMVIPVGRTRRSTSSKVMLT